MLIIPAIDIIDSKVVRLSKGEFESKKEYSISPIEQATIFYKYGFNRLHIVDLNGSKKGDISVLEIVKQIKKRYPVAIQFGGGIRKFEDVQNAFEHGADKVIIGSLSVTDKGEFEKIVSSFSPKKIIVASDTLKGEIMIKGWTEGSGITIDEHIEYCNSIGLNDFLCTDISKDGMLKGPSMGLYSALQYKYPSINLIASGGISCIKDIEELKQIKMYAAVVGKAIYENKIELKELKEIAD